MTSKITALEHPSRFVDEQTRGPFRSFHHEHTFADDGDRTLMIDTVTLVSPMGGQIAERIVLVPYLRRLIRRRNAHLLASLGVGISTDPALVEWPHGGEQTFRRYEASALIGRGDAAWERASRDILHWAVKTRSGFSVDNVRAVTPGDVREVTVRVAGVTVREPVEVVDVVKTATRVGFSHRTLPGHPVRGEEAFIVTRDGDAVSLTIRSLTAASNKQPWRALYPLLRVAQTVERRRYLRALR